jgi:hypothetical protein
VVEQQVATNCLSIIQSNTQILNSQLNLKFRLDRYTITAFTPPADTLHKLKSFYILIWCQLAFSYQTTTREILFKIVQDVDHILQLFVADSPFTFPNNTAKPSVFTQIVASPKAILDPIICSLQQNYYYPISLEPLIMPDEHSMSTEPSDVNHTLDPCNLVAATPTKKLTPNSQR